MYCDPQNATNCYTLYDGPPVSNQGNCSGLGPNTEALGMDLTDDPAYRVTNNGSIPAMAICYQPNSECAAGIVSPLCMFCFNNVDQNPNDCSSYPIDTVPLQYDKPIVDFPYYERNPKSCWCHNYYNKEKVFGPDDLFWEGEGDPPTPFYTGP